MYVVYDVRRVPYELANKYTFLLYTIRRKYGTTCEKWAKSLLLTHSTPRAELTSIQFYNFKCKIYIAMQIHRLTDKSDFILTIWLCIESDLERADHS